MLKRGKYKMVMIKWIDSMSFRKVWWSFEDLEAEIKDRASHDYMWSVGYLVRENKSNYYICNSIHFEDDMAISAGQVFTIPKGCVLKIINIKQYGSKRKTKED